MQCQGCGIDFNELFNCYYCNNSNLCSICLRQCFICKKNLVCEKCLVACSSCGKDFCAFDCQFYECEICFPLQDINYCMNCKCPCIEKKSFKKELIEESRDIFIKKEIVPMKKEHSREETLEFLQFCETKCKTVTQKLFMQKQLALFESSF